MKKTLLIAASSLLAFASAGFSATLVGSVDSNPAMGVNLTTEGTLDWAIWNSTSSGTTASKAPTNTKVTGLGLISNVTPVSGGSVRGASAGTQTFTYVDGTSPTAQTNATFGLALNSQLSTIGAGVHLSITGNPALAYKVNIWTTGFRATGQMTASLAGAADVVLSGDAFASTKVPELYSFTFQPDLASDTLNIDYVITALPDFDTGSGHIGFQAVTVSVVPEPTTIAMLLGGLGLLIGFQRARRR